jgi:hypothetical protein
MDFRGRMFALLLVRTRRTLLRDAMSVPDNAGVKLLTRAEGDHHHFLRAYRAARRMEYAARFAVIGRCQQPAPGRTFPGSRLLRLPLAVRWYWVPLITARVQRIRAMAPG